MEKEKNNTASIDEEYKEATQSVVDDRMRTDVLGPKVCNIFKDYTPAKEAIEKIAREAIRKDPDTQKEIKGVIENYNKEAKIRWLDRGLGAIGTIIVAVIIWLLETWIRK